MRAAASSPMRVVAAAGDERLAVEVEVQIRLEGVVHPELRGVGGPIQLAEDVAAAVGFGRAARQRGHVLLRVHLPDIGGADRQLPLGRRPHAESRREGEVQAAVLVAAVHHLEVALRLRPLARVHSQRVGPRRGPLHRRPAARQPHVLAAELIDGVQLGLPEVRQRDADLGPDGRRLEVAAEVPLVFVTDADRVVPQPAARRRLLILQLARHHDAVGPGQPADVVGLEPGGRERCRRFV